MKKIIGLVFIIFSLNVNAMENKGFFIGFDLGNGEVASDVRSTFSGNIKTTFNVNSYGIKLIGHKYFFSDYIGIREYLSLDYQEMAVSVKGLNNTRLGLLNYGINADILVNFYNTNFLNVGLFAGLGIGGTSIFVNSVAGNDTDLRFNANAKVGLRLNIEQNHGIEFGATIPIVNGKVNEETTSATIGGVTYTDKQELRVKPTYILNLSYIFTF
ncbi:outer membrane beta-barrel protein [Helicobacter sp. MIT 14-3879]|uniref:outer membrane beta-barrel protein n=1 Tax=Helicobacter sp. MIT 14-3879 TaxID=2040649 RepID=UPI0015F12D6A|nr:outer membrane beta-barrel protein [Helicobacter sp. MIT 14-3879]